MVRYPFAAAAALIALAPASPAAASHKPIHRRHACAAPAAVSAPMPSLSRDSELEDKIDQLTGTIADLTDRLQTLEDAIGTSDDDGSSDGDAGVGVDLARARAAHRPGFGHTASRRRMGAV